MVNAQIAAANASMQKMYETGEPGYVNTIGLDDSQSWGEFVGSGVNLRAEETYDYYGRDGGKGPVVVPTFTNAHISGQGMQSLISIGGHQAEPSLTICLLTAFTAICLTAFVEKQTNEHKELAFDEFSHVDFCYKPKAVKASTDAVAEINPMVEVMAP